MAVLAHCPEHGHRLGTGDQGQWLCREGHEVAQPEQVEYVRADLHRGAVAENEQLRADLARVRGQRDRLRRVIALVPHEQQMRIMRTIASEDALKGQE